MLEQNKSNKITPENINIKYGNTECNLLLDSGSGCIIINLSRAKNIMYNCEQAKWSEKNH